MTNLQHRPKLSFWSIFNMSFGFLGIQFGFALQGGFMSRIFQTLGASQDDIPALVNELEKIVNDQGNQ